MSMFTGPNGALAYDHRTGTGPTLVFLPGWRSDRSGTKALALDAWCEAHGRALRRFDYFGHGQSAGAFEDGTISIWLADTLAMIDSIEGPVVLCGSSMGGWLALLAARARPARVAGLIGIAAAPDFSHDLMLPALPESLRTQLARDGFADIASGYDTPARVRQAFFDDAAVNLVLRAPLPVRCPIRLLHGQRDPDVPWPTALRIAETVASDDVTVTLVKDGDHRLSRPHDLTLLMETAGKFFGEDGG